MHYKNKNKLQTTIHLDVEERTTNSNSITTITKEMFSQKIIKSMAMLMMIMVMIIKMIIKTRMKKIEN